MTPSMRTELIERIMWLVDGYRFEYLSRAEVINRLSDLVELYASGCTVKIGDFEYGWTQPACDTCFSGLFPNNPNPVRMKEELAEYERCCMCGVSVRNGLYIRVNPSTVPHPTPEGDFYT